MISASTVISFAMLHGDFLLVSGVTTPEDAAAYVGARRCIQLISMPLIVVNTMAAGVITPLLASGRKTLLEQTLRGFCGAASILAVLMSIPLVVFPELSLRIILGDGYSAGTTALMILVPGQLIFVFTGSCGLLLSLKGCQRTVFTISLVSLILLAVLSPLAGARYGSAGLATVLTTIIAGNNLATWLAARRLTGINTWCSLSWLLKLRRLMAAGKSSWQFRVRPGAADVR